MLDASLVLQLTYVKRILETLQRNLVAITSEEVPCPMSDSGSSSDAFGGPSLGEPPCG